MVTDPDVGPWRPRLALAIALGFSIPWWIGVVVLTRWTF